MQDNVTDIQDYVTDIQDYIIEQGTSGIWTYRKWASGIAECWGTINQTITSWSGWGNSFNGVYAIFEGTPAVYENYPSGLFISAPKIFVTPDGSSPHVGIMGVEVFDGGTNIRTPTLYCLRPNAIGSTTIAINFEAKGLWK